MFRAYACDLRFVDVDGDGIMTKDLVGLVDEGTPVTAVNSSEFIGAIHDRLAAKL